MLEYIAKRTLGAVVSLFIVITLIFLLLRMMPMEGYFGAEYDKLSEETRASMLAEKGLDKPVLTQHCFYRYCRSSADSCADAVRPALFFKLV